MGGKGGRVFRNMYKGRMDKTKRVGSRVGSGDGWGGGEWWGEMETLYLNNSKTNSVQNVIEFET